MFRKQSLRNLSKNRLKTEKKSSRKEKAKMQQRTLSKKQYKKKFLRTEGYQIKGCPPMRAKDNERKLPTSSYIIMNFQISWDKEKILKPSKNKKTKAGRQ